MKKRLLLLLSASFLLRPAIAAHWNENLQGDLSDNGNAPTPIVFGLGVNTVSGTMGKDLPQDPVDRDIFTFTLGAGLQLTSIHFLVFEPTNQSFYALAPGASINLSNPATHLSNTLVNGTGEFLPALVNLERSQGGGTWSSIPVGNRLIGPGTYTLWLQELSSVVTYETAYTVTAVPEPSTYGFYGLMGMLLAGWFYKRETGAVARLWISTCMARKEPKISAVK